ncbi:MAG: alpha-amylase family glycosyl hydrolase [Opitutaceae bacterium]
MFPKTTANTTQFKVWAQNAEQVTLRIYKDGNSVDQLMRKDPWGNHETIANDCGHGALYHYVINGQSLPDPASTFQPNGVHGPSMVIDFNTMDWSCDKNWRGIELNKLIFYELHIGTFTKEGTYLSAIERLNELVELGINAVQIMPVAQCPGKWNWGYDGVQLYAANHNYGSPEDLCELVKACHARGLAIYLDVVYNHLGPEGNYLGQFAPYFHEHATAWGDCPDMSRPEVRAFFIENARFWIEHYHFDGIRFDAIAMIHDPSPTHIMNEIGTLYRELSKKLDREIHAIGESNIYQPEFLPEHEGTMHALWSDDLGHAAEAAVAPINTHGTRDYNGAEDLLRALQAGCLYLRTPTGHAERRPDDAPPVVIRRCINQLQNHDIVGNSPSGRRIHHYNSTDCQRALAALFILYPAIPMIFMGEEFSAKTPFLFFTDFESEHLREAVERGRAAEFPQHSWETAISPTSPEAFYNSKLPEQCKGDYSSRVWYTALIELRKEWIAGGFIDSDQLQVLGISSEGIFVLNYKTERGSRFVAVKIGSGVTTLRMSGPRGIQRQSGNAYLKENRLSMHSNCCIAGTGHIEYIEQTHGLSELAQQNIANRTN